jgi:diguanylate cyclase (GGDEF)-like protein
MVLHGGCQCAARGDQALIRGFGSSIRLWLMAGFGAIALVMAGMAVYFGQFVDRQRAAIETLRSEQEAFVALNRIASSFTAVQTAMLNPGSTDEQIAQAWETFDDRLALFGRYDPEHAGRIGQQVEAYRVRAVALRQVTLARASPEVLERETLANRAEVIALAGLMREAFDALDLRYKQLLDRETQSQATWGQVFRTLTISAIALLLLFAMFLARAIIRPLTATLQGIRAVRAGTVPPELPQSGEFSEIGRVLDDLSRANRLASQLAFTDSMTGLPNREGFEHALGIELIDARRSDRSLTVVFIEMSRLSVISSAHGPAVAGRCLAGLADRLTGLVGDGRGLARVGDFCFACYIRDTAGVEGELTVWVERLLQQLAEPLSVDALRVRIQPCAGLARFPSDGEDVASLIAAAEAALATARTNGRVATFDREMVDHFRHDLVLAQELEHATAHAELVPYFEPVVNLARGEVITVEALVRWNHPQRGLLAPGDFIPLAERTGQIAAIDDSLFEQACRQLAAWHQTGHNFSLAFNMSPQTLTASTVERVLRRVEKYRIPANRLIVELTETAIIAREQDTHQAIRDLHTLGTVVCLDDFGSGYSSLSYLLGLPITRLKVDRSFVAEIGRSVTAERIIEATLLLANQLGVTVIAEGVETVEQMSWLAQRRCVRQQGWLYARAQPAADFERWLQTAPELITDIYEQMEVAA